MKLNLKIVTPERVLYEGEVDQVSLTTQMGQITVLPNHIPLVANLQPGEIIIKKGHEYLDIASQGGFVEISPLSVVVLADAAARADELDEKQVEEAVKRAEAAVSQVGVADHDYAALKAMLDVEVSKLRVARRYKQRGFRTSADQ